MGLLSGITSTVGIVMKADTSQAKRATKELAGEQKKLAKATVDGLEKQNAALDSSLKKWGKIAVGVGAAIAAFKGAQASFNAFAKDTQMRGAAAGINIDKLRKASQGLISDIDLLTQAAAFNNTAFKLNTEEMAEVQKFMLVPRKQGNSLVEVQKRVTQAFVEGKVEALEPFGVVIENVGNKTQKAANLLAEARKINEGFTGSLSMSGDTAKKAGISIGNSFRDIRVAIGKMVSALGPLLTTMARGIALMAEGVNAVVKSIDFKDAIDANTQSNLTQRQAAGIGAYRVALAEQTKRRRALTANARTAANAFLTPGDPASASGGSRGGGSRGGGLGFVPGVTGTVTRTGFNEPSGSGPSFGQGPRIGDVGLGGINNEIETQKFNIAQSKIKRIRDNTAQLKDQFFARKNESFMEQTFGPIGQFDLYAGAFQGLTSAVGASMNAWITGSKSFAAAFKEAISSSLGGLAVQMQVEALKEAAYGFSRIAFYDGRGAAAHFKSAAAFQAGAVAAAVGAKALGSSGGGSASVSGGAPNVIGATGGSGGGGGNVTIIVGDDFSRTDPRKRATQMSRILRDTKRYHGSDSEVSFG